MSELGDLLALMHGAHARISTVRATVRTWRHLRRTHEAMESLPGTTMYAVGEGREPESTESVVRLWLAPPDRQREEREDPDGSSLSVQRGRVWWRYDPYNGARTNEDDLETRSGNIGSEFPWLLDPAPAIGLLNYLEIAPGRRAGRHVLRVRAVPRDRDGFGLGQLGLHAADELLLDVDSERGALLRVECRFEGRPFSIAEVEDVAFDEQFPDETFTFTPPPGEEIRSTAADTGVWRGITIERAVALAPFTVWIPARLPADWETKIGVGAEQERPPMPPHVYLHYRAPDGTHGVMVSQSPAGHPAAEEYEPAGASPWRDIERGGRAMQVRDPAEDWQPAQLRMELDGTRIDMHSNDVGADALADLAAGLVRAPAEPPDLGP
jgi:outer membrane lipoprotein-sorting protein